MKAMKTVFSLLSCCLFFMAQTINAQLAEELKKDLEIAFAHYGSPPLILVHWISVNLKYEVKVDNIPLRLDDGMEIFMLCKRVVLPIV